MFVGSPVCGRTLVILSREPAQSSGVHPLIQVGKQHGLLFPTLHSQEAPSEPVFKIKSWGGGKALRLVLQKQCFSQALWEVGYGTIGILPAVSRILSTLTVLCGTPGTCLPPPYTAVLPRLRRCGAERLTGCRGSVRVHEAIRGSPPWPLLCSHDAVLAP